MIKVLVVSDDNMAAALEAISSPEIIQRVLQDVMTGARDFWSKRASEKFTSTARDYINGIQEVEVNGMTASVSLVGHLPNLLENGMPAYDMHSTLLGPNVPVVPAGQGMKGKHETSTPGKYWRVIPFRHQTPGSAGKGGGTPMGDPYKGHSAVADAAALGKAIHKKAMRLKASKRDASGKTQWGGRLAEGLAPKLKAAHATDIYAGMVKVQHEYEKGPQNTYMTFRIISDLVPEKFMHPGLQAADLASDVEKYVDGLAEAAFSALLELG